MKRSLFLFVAFLTFSATLFAHHSSSLPKNVKALTRYVEKLPSSSVGTMPFQGHVIAIEKGLLKLSVPFAPAEEVLRTEESNYAIGSVTKHIVGLELLHLQAQKKLSLDDAISKSVDGLPAWAKGVTLRQLANHTGGFGNYTNNPKFDVLKYKSFDLKKILALADVQEPKHPPGKMWAYSNTHYYLLASAIERATGEPYMNALKKGVLNAPALAKVDSYKKRKMLQGSMRGEKGASVPVPLPHPSGPSAAGELSMSPKEITAWAKTIMNLDPKTMAAFTQGSQAREDYGLGIFKDKDSAWIHHGGGIDGFQTYFAVNPKTKSAVIVLGSCMGCGVNSIGDWVRTWLSEGSLPPLPKTLNAVSAQTLKSHPGTYALNAKKSGGAASLPPAVLAAIQKATLLRDNKSLLFKPAGQSAIPLMNDGKALVGPSGISLTSGPVKAGKMQSFILQQGPFHFHYERL